MKKGIKSFLIILLILIAVVAVIVILLSKKTKKDNGDADDYEGLFEAQTYDAIGTDTSYPMTPMDTEDGKVSLTISNGAPVMWVVECSDGIKDSFIANDNNYTVIVSLVPVSAASETDATVDSFNVKVYSEVVGISYEIKLERNSEGRLHFASGKCELIEKNVSVLVDDKNKPAFELLKLPEGAVVSYTTNDYIGDDKTSNNVKPLCVIYILNQEERGIRVTKDVTDTKLCNILEKTEFKGYDYKVSNETTSGVKVTCYTFDEEIFAIWQDEGLTYLYVGDATDGIKGILATVDSYVTGEKVK